MRTERQKMLAGELYDPLDPDLLAGRERGPDLLRNRAQQFREHRRHQGALLLGQAIARIEEKVLADGRQAASARGSRRIASVVLRRSGNRPFVRHHVQIIIRLRLMRRQLTA